MSSIGSILFDKEKLKFIKIADLRLNNSKEAEDLIKIYSFTFADKFTISTGFFYPLFKPK